MVSYQSFTMEFRATNRQFDWFKISLVYNKSNKHNTVYDSYNVEKASTFIQSMSLENI